MENASRKWMVLLGVAFALTTQSAFANGQAVATLGLTTTDTVTVVRAMSAANQAAFEAQIFSSFRTRGLDWAGRVAAGFSGVAQSVRDGKETIENLVEWVNNSRLNGDVVTRAAGLVPRGTDITVESMRTTSAVTNFLASLRTEQATASTTPGLPTRPVGGDGASATDAVAPSVLSAAFRHAETRLVTTDTTLKGRVERRIRQIAACAPTNTTCRDEEQHMGEVFAAATVPCTGVTVPNCPALKMEAATKYYGQYYLGVLLPAATAGNEENVADLTNSPKFVARGLRDQYAYPNRAGILTGLNTVVARAGTDSAYRNSNPVVIRCLNGRGETPAATATATR